ncbi:hypothetical protein D3C76_1198480 [compost metagenome]
MVDIQQGALCAFEHDQVATLARAVQQFRNINNHCSQDVGDRQHVIQSRLVINGFDFVVVNQLEVMIINNFLQLNGEGFFVEQVADAQTATSYFIFVSRADTATGGTDSFRATCFLTRVIQRNMVRQDQRTGFGQ